MIRMHFCNACGAPVEHRIPDGDSLPRFVCRACGEIHYHNPKIITGTVACWEDRVLMCRRAIEPRHGLWTLPAGFLEIGETAAAGAARETREEACAEVEMGELYTLINVTYIGQVYMFYRARLLEPKFAAGAESLAVELMREDQIPWDELAFPTVRLTLQDYFADYQRGEYELHTHDLTVSPWSGQTRREIVRKG